MEVYTTNDFAYDGNIYHPELNLEQSKGCLSYTSNHVKDSRKINNVLIYKLDRLTRSVKDLIYLIENCTFNSQTEKIDTSNAVGRMFVKIIGIFAEFERENLAERVTFGYEQKTKEGNYTNCNGVFGYDYLAGIGKLKVNKNEAIYIKKIFNWYLDGESMVKIAKKLKDLKSVIRKIMINQQVMSMQILQIQLLYLIFGKKVIIMKQQR